MKLKLDQKGIQQFFLEHTEKIVFGFVVVAFLVFVYQGLTQERYKDKPDALLQAVKNATAHIDRAQKAVMGSFDFGGLSVDINPDKYPLAKFYVPPKPPKRLRDAPPVLPIQDVRAVAGRGSIMMAPQAQGGGAAAGGGRGNAGQPQASGMRWILLTGRVPLKEQREKYNECFQHAPSPDDPSRDLPRYVGFLVERAEVGPGSNGKVQWSEQFTNQTMRAATQKWANTGGRGKPETVDVDPKCINPNLCSPLPPRTDREWGPEIACEPLIPIYIPEKTEGGERDPRRPPDGFGLGRDRGPAPPGMGRDGRGGEGGDLAFGAEPKPADKEKDAGRRPGKPDEGLKDVDNLLFRFFDFEVEPGKQYRYRVFLVLENPNYDLPSKVLEEQALAVPKFIGIVPKGSDKQATATFKVNEAFAKWSEPTPPVGIEDDVRVLAWSVKQPRIAGDEPTGTVRIVKWLEDRGVNAWEAFPIRRGKVLDFVERKFRIVDAPPPAGADIFREGGRPGRPTRKPKPAKAGGESIPVEYETDTVVVDLAGGEAKALSRPGEVLLLDPSGDLVIRDEVTDQALFEVLCPPPPAPKVPEGRDGAIGREPDTGVKPPRAKTGDVLDNPDIYGPAKKTKPAKKAPS